MTTLEIIMLLIGLAFIVVSFVMPAGKSIDVQAGPAAPVSLTDYQIESIQNQVDDAVSRELDNAVEKTEISLDKISNTKILEMQEYANTILSEMNRNHNETMFLYDMLNEKSKEIKAIVREINLLQKNSESAQQAGEAQSSENQNIRDQELIEKLFLQAADEEAAAAMEEETDSEETQQKRTSAKKSTASKRTKETSETTSARKKKTAAKETDEENGKTAATAARTRKKAEESAPEENEKQDTNARILSMYQEGKSVLEIAKELNLGIGQTKLVIDLFKGKK